MEQRPTKRKRTSSTNARNPDPPSASEEEVDTMSILRAHFESRFEPISITPLPTHTAPPPSTPPSEEWISPPTSPSSSARAPEIIEHTISEHEARSRLPTKPSKPTNASTEPDSAAGDPSEKLNLANDLALQRLLRESHLLDGGTLDLTGRNRHKAVAARIEGLGAKPLAGQKMSMALRRGIEGKSALREKKRRAEARESGVVLEKEVRKRVGGKGEKRDRGFAPAVGKWKGGALVLSKKDVAEIEGKREGGKGRKKGRR